MVRSPGVACFGGQGLLLNRLKGKGWVFLNASGTVMWKQLRAGERLIVDTHSLVAFENTVQYILHIYIYLSESDTQSGDNENNKSLWLCFVCVFFVFAVWIYIYIYI